VLKEPTDEKRVADAILKVHKNIKVVLQEVSPVSGTFRIKEYKFVAGESRTETVYRENGFSFAVDLTKAYFSPRLATERSRIASTVAETERVLDMFAGVGCFAVQMARKAKEVIAVDINPDAVRYLRKNIAMNKARNVRVVEGDARELVEAIGRVDRVIMDFPTGALEFLDCAFQVLKDGGIIHYYDICSDEEIDGLAAKIRERIKNAKIEILSKRKIRPYAPYKYNVVLDIRINK